MTQYLTAGIKGCAVCNLTDGKILHLFKLKILKGLLDVLDMYVSELKVVAVALPSDCRQEC